MYLNCQSNKFRKPTIVFYALCLLYLLSTFTVVRDLVIITLQLVVGNILSVKLLFFTNQFWSIVLIVVLWESFQYWNFRRVPPSLSVTDIQLIILRLGIIQSVASGCCDLIAQCIMVCINHCTYLNSPFYSPSKSSKIYRCWIVWDKNICLVIIPSFMAIAYIGQSIYLHLISNFNCRL